ncbi:creatinine amidohydrolase [Pilimelia anulata]|uniref:Creatinine amidohydrolase n=1 Tax=Pilimelia anulata TaxID=53371 RepID=A0A8J3B5B1_9ACTN|nr:creatininase family protein [Pilimelia anulata]GGJ88290.1 creatinine amidohydrolase [Pilimelia anulata]
MDLISTATSADEAQRASDVAVLPIGSFEQHGEHLPLATDTIIASSIANAVAAAYGLFLLPPITISCSHEHSAWPGTLSISHRTLSAMINDIADSLRRSGVHRLALVNGHGGNYVLSNIVQEANIARPAMTLFPTRDDWHAARAAAGLASTSHDDMHGGELEVSILRHVIPKLAPHSVDEDDHLSGERSLLLVHGMAAYTKSGIIGQPSLATAAKGEALLASLVRGFSTHLDALRGPDRS